MDKKILKDSFDAAYLEYREEPMDENYKNFLVGILARGRVKRVVREAGALINKKVLDLGCEAGYVSIQLAKKGALVTAMDICDPALASFRKKLRNINLARRITILKGMAQDIPLDKNSFDYVICTEVIEHLPYMEKSLSEMKRVLKPNGKLIITFPNERLRKKLYPLAKLVGINTDVEEQVTLFSYSVKKIKAKLSKIMKVEKLYSWPKLLPVTRFVVCRKPKQ